MKYIAIIHFLEIWRLEHNLNLKNSRNSQVLSPIIFLSVSSTFLCYVPSEVSDNGSIMLYFIVFQNMKIVILAVFYEMLITGLKDRSASRILLNGNYCACLCFKKICLYFYLYKLLI